MTQKDLELLEVALGRFITFALNNGHGPAKFAAETLQQHLLDLLHSE